jgi:hypothetical protein
MTVALPHVKKRVSDLNDPVHDPQVNHGEVYHALGRTRTEEVNASPSEVADSAKPIGFRRSRRDFNGIG